MLQLESHILDVADTATPRLRGHVVSWSEFRVIYMFALRIILITALQVDATVMPVSMPSDVILTSAMDDGTYEIEIVEAERRFWVPYKHVHGIKFQVCGTCFDVDYATRDCTQALALCNGLIGDLSGIVLGARHDAYLYEQCELDQRLHAMHVNVLHRPPQQYRPFTALADSAYAETLYVKRVLSGNSAPAVLLSALRCPVEHSFCKLYREFPSLKSRCRNKIFARQVCVTNVFNCNCNFTLLPGTHRKICVLHCVLQHDFVSARCTSTVAPRHLRHHQHRIHRHAAAPRCHRPH